MTKGTELWNSAKKIIPGGTQLLSKRPEMFLPEQWPSYFKKAKGVEVWDLDGTKYIDMSIMGMGTCILGYANDSVNKAVKKAIDEGNMCTLNCEEEVECADKLIELHPWAQKVRFARSGGEACSIAVRIARAFSKKEKVAFCGYHGWSDWYLATNLSNPENLNEQLLPGLEPAGVPKGLKGTAIPFHYGNLDELRRIVSSNKGEIGVIIMEVQRFKDIDAEFLRSVRKLADEIDAVLIFDEVTSGFRLRAGGMHVMLGLEPDMVVLGKAMGNGYPISAVVGKDAVMEAAQETFISSTFWTERIGFTAAIEVIRQFEHNRVAEHITKIGEHIKQGLKQVIEAEGLPINVMGKSAVPALISDDTQAMEMKTLFTQEMLKKGYLASNLIYVSFAHSEKIADQYLKAAQEVFGKISKAKRNNTFNEFLEGPVCHSGFGRLN